MHRNHHQAETWHQGLLQATGRGSVIRLRVFTSVMNETPLQHQDLRCWAVRTGNESAFVMKSKGLYVRNKQDMTSKSYYRGNILFILPLSKW